MGGKPSETKTSLEAFDLRLVMDNYRNLLQMSTILVEQQKQLMDTQRQILEKHENVSIKQATVCVALDKIITSLDDCAKELITVNKSVGDMCHELSSTLEDSFEKSNETLVDVRVDNTKEHSSIKNKIYVAMGGTAAAIVSLVTLFILLMERNTILSQVSENISKLLSYFNIN